MSQTTFNILALSAIAIFIILKVIKNRNDEWEGELIKKRYDSDDDSLSTPTSFVLVFKTDKGKKKNVIINNSESFDDWKEGQRVRKLKGERVPEKI